MIAKRENKVSYGEVIWGWYLIFITSQNSAINTSLETGLTSKKKKQEQSALGVKISYARNKWLTLSENTLFRKFSCNSK